MDHSSTAVGGGEVGILVAENPDGLGLQSRWKMSSCSTLLKCKKTDFVNGDRECGETVGYVGGYWHAVIESSE